MKYTIDSCKTNQEWDEFIERSPNSSPFMMSWYIQLINKIVYRFFCYRNGTPIAAFLLYEEDGKIINPPYSSYHSICFAESVKSTRNTNYTTIQFEATTMISQFITDLFQYSISLSLNPSIVDVRPFIWLNYHNLGSRMFSVSLRYTAILNLQEFNCYEHYRNKLPARRKSDYKKSINEGNFLDSLCSPSEATELYKSTFERQNIIVNPYSISFIDNLISIISASNNRLGFLSVVRNNCGVALSLTISLVHNNFAYSIVIANDSNSLSTGISTHCVLGAIETAYSLNIRQYDFVGANSPNRGNFKLSFNPSLFAYYELSCPGEVTSSLPH